jgi:UDP-N-acetylmuramate dehydrogenase
LPAPEDIGNCGSFFKNPIIAKADYAVLNQQHPGIKYYPTENSETVKIPAGWLIEQSGWKGFKRGNAGVHTKQALVLVNYGHAKGEEIFALAKEIQADVFQKFGILLEMEVNIR